jgi:hypothetical protein
MTDEKMQPNLDEQLEQTKPLWPVRYRQADCGRRQAIPLTGGAMG